VLAFDITNYHATERLCSQKAQFILIIGDFDVGMSSVLDAGLLLKLKESDLPDGKTAFAHEWCLWSYNFERKTKISKWKNI
jgi:hypothetical protein